MKMLMTRAQMLKDRFVSCISKKEKGVDQIVVIMIIIAVAAGVIGGFYVWGRSVLLPAVEESINTSISNWFNPST